MGAELTSSEVGKVILEDTYKEFNQNYALRLASFEDEIVIFKMVKGSWRRVWVDYLKQESDRPQALIRATEKYREVLKNAKAQKCSRR